MPKITIPTTPLSPNQDPSPTVPMVPSNQHEPTYAEEFFEAMAAEDRLVGEEKVKMPLEAAAKKV